MTERAKDSSVPRPISLGIERLALGAATLAVVLIALLSYRDAASFARLIDQLDSSQRIAQSTADLVASLTDAETGQRGFLLTGRASYLDPYNRAVSDVPGILTDLANLTANRQDQTARVETVKGLAQQKLNELQATINLRRSHGLDAALTLVLSDSGKVVMDQIWQVSRGIKMTARGRMVQQAGAARFAANRTRIMITVGSLLIFGLLISATITVHRGTERRQALIETLRDREGTLRDSQQLLQALVQNSPAAIYVKTLSGHYALVNRRFEELPHLASARAQTTGKTDYDLFTKEQADAFRAGDHDVVSSGQATEKEAELRVENDLRTFLSIKFPISDADGRTYAVAGIVTDITERKRAETATALLAGIVESSDDAILSKTLDGIVTSWNAGAERIFGYSAAEMIGQPISLLIPPEAGDEEPGILARIRNGEFIDHYETVRMRKDGARIHVSLTVSPIRDTNLRIIGASKIARDISERKRAGEKLRAQVERLALLDDITRAIGEHQDLRSIFQVVVRSLEDSLPIDFGCICLYDAGASALAVTCVGVRSEALATKLTMSENTPIYIDQNGLSRCISGKLVYEPDILHVDFPFPAG